MLERLHQHMTEELQRNARVDTIAILTSVGFNLLVLGINSAIAAASGGRSSLTEDLVLMSFFVVTFVVNGLAVMALTLGRSNSAKLLDGLMMMYQGNGVDKYFDPALMTGMRRRYSVFIAISLALAATAILIPLIIWLT
jgi:hypothetical protein